MFLWFAQKTSLYLGFMVMVILGRSKKIDPQTCVQPSHWPIETANQG